MDGAVAAGHPLTARAGIDVLEAGGNAVDACVAASLASWVAESPLTGPGGGGFMLVHRARDRSTRVFDFFVAIPGLGGGRASAQMDAVEVDFSGGSTQVFRVGGASVAVPGTVAGLEAAHRSFGSLPWAELFEPAVRLARGGVELTREQAYLHEILDPILRHTAESRTIYGRDGRALAAGDRLAMPELAATMELVAAHGSEPLYRGELARAVVAHVREQGGALTEEDLRRYRVVRRRPVSTPFLGYEFRSNPPPSAGGVLIGYGLRLLERGRLGGPPGSAGAAALLVEVMREQARARDRRFAAQLHRGGLARRLQASEALELGWARIQAGAQAHAEPVAAGGTTHVSVLDAAGNAASLSISTGAGSGVVVPGTGIQLNNMLGEFDLDESGGGARPGTRLTSGMAPSIALEDGRTRLVLGSAGSLRLRGAVLQVAVNVLGHGLGVEEAVARPRLHWDGDVVHCEGGTDPAVLEELERRGNAVAGWRERNLYFGGVSAVERRNGALAAAGDPRRGGHGVVVG
ncbi:MAG TPA: gamma-glutamyltransferase [Gaiellaceae bacterium]|nr:gamma-glutamyltransferase [Gaiellaceae bacterium]